ncbi:MAG: MFS transporter [Bacillota bacterium]
MKLKRLKNIPLVDKLGYGTGNLGSGIIFQAINTYIVFYATVILNLPGSLVGVAVSISIIWDGFTDPIMGYISDRSRFKRLGRRHAYLLIGTLFSALINYYLWSINPAYPLVIKFAWLLLTIILVKTFLTVFGTPYIALGAELSCDYNERTGIQAIRTIFFLLGIFLASSLGLYLFFHPTPEYPIGQLNPGAYRNIGIASSIMMIIFGLISFFSTKKYIPFLYQLDKEDKLSLKLAIRRAIKGVIDDFLTAIKNHNYRAVLLGYLFTNLAVALFIAIGLHVFTFTFKMNNTEIAVIIGAQFITSILTQPIWVKLSNMMDKKPAAILGLSISIIGGLILLAAVLFRDIIIDNYAFLLPYALMAGFGTGGLLTLPASMVADVIDVEELRTGVRLEGVYYGCLTFAYKTSQSIAILLLGIFLDVINFNASLAVQSDFNLFLLGMVLAFGGIISLLISLKFYLNYGLDYSMIKEVQSKLSE